MVVVCDICGVKKTPGTNVCRYWLEFYKDCRKKDINKNLDLCEVHANWVKDRLEELLNEIKEM